MEIQIIDASDKTYPLQDRRYFIATARCGKHEVTVSISHPLKDRTISEVRVIVHNASNRAWQNIGKRFPDAMAAVANYKTAEIRQIIMAVTAAAIPAVGNA